MIRTIFSRNLSNSIEDWSQQVRIPSGQTFYSWQSKYLAITSSSSRGELQVLFRRNEKVLLTIPYTDNSEIRRIKDAVSVIYGSPTWLAVYIWLVKNNQLNNLVNLVKGEINAPAQPA